MIFTHSNEESRIQENIKNRLVNKGFKYDIITDKVEYQLNKEHNFLLLSSHKNLFKGLRKHLFLKNKKLFEDFADLYSKEELNELLLQDFIKKWNKANSNTDYYNLVFNNDFLNISLKDKDNLPVIKSYNVISYENSADNEYTIIKEKIFKGAKNTEKPDFAMFLNGIPLIVFEVKTKTTGLKKALKEYGTKSTYSKFILCLGTDGEKVFLTGNKNFYFKWKKYGKHISNNTDTGLEDLISELFDQPENLLFYFKYGVMIGYNKDTNQPECLINHRVQQYYTLKYINQKLTSIQVNNTNKDSLLNELVKHVQRSGKSITIRSAVNLIADKYTDLFKKIYVCVPDLTILDVMRKTFIKNQVKVTEIKCKKDFVESVNSSHSSFEIFLHNIQKTSDDFNTLEISQLKNTNNNIIFFIDEVHFSQSKSQADKRYQVFPKASYLTFTATPKIKEKTQEEIKLFINETAIRYGDNIDGNIQYLDELNATDAVSMGIILPVFYEKMKFSHFYDNSMARAFDNELSFRFKKTLNDSEFHEQIKVKQEEAEYKIRNDENNQSLSEEQINNLIFQSNKAIELAYFNSLSMYADKLLVEEAFIHLKDQKIDFIVDDLKKKKEILVNNNGTYSFIPKAFLVVSSKEEARLYLDIIKSKSLSNNNVYLGIHFGVDYSEDQISTQDNDELNILNNINNPETKIIDLFESQKTEIDENGQDKFINERVDVLIIVNKYLMGYDNPELMVVYCDRKIKEPAKLYQLITRPATTREDKQQGFFVDMTLGNDNYNVYLNKCLPYYDNNKGTTIANLTPEETEEQKARLLDTIERIRSILGYPKDHIILDELEAYNRLISYNENKTPKEIIQRKNAYFECFKQINKHLEILITPKYYLENLDEIMVLLKINQRYLSEDCPKNEEDFLFDKDKIKKIILDTLSFFQKDIEDINKFQISNIAKTQDKETLNRIDFNNMISNFKVSLSIFGMEEPKQFSERIKQWSKEISEKGFESSDFTQKFKEEFEEPFIKLKRERKETIQNQFKGSLTWYMAHNALIKGLSLIENNYPSIKSIPQDFFKIYSEKMSEKIIEIIPDSNVYLEDKTYYLNKIKENIKIELKDFNIDSALAKQFYKATKELHSYLKSNDYLSESSRDIFLSEQANTGYLWVLFMFDDYYTELYNKVLNENV